jgi:hypothetical protein
MHVVRGDCRAAFIAAILVLGTLDHIQTAAAVRAKKLVRNDRERHGVRERRAEASTRRGTTRLPPRPRSESIGRRFSAQCGYSCLWRPRYLPVIRRHCSNEMLRKPVEMRRQNYFFAAFSAAQRFFCPRAIRPRAAALTWRFLLGSGVSIAGEFIAGTRLFSGPCSALMARSNLLRSSMSRATIESVGINRIVTSRRSRKREPCRIVNDVLRARVIEDGPAHEIDRLLRAVSRLLLPQRHSDGVVDCTGLLHCDEFPVPGSLGGISVIYRCDVCGDSI